MSATTLIRVQGAINPDYVIGVDLPFREGLVGYYEAETSLPASLRNWANKSAPLSYTGTPAVDPVNGGATLDAVNSFGTELSELLSFTVMVVVRIPAMTSTSSPTAMPYGNNVSGSGGTALFTQFRSDPDRTVISMLANGFTTQTINLSAHDQYHVIAYSIDATVRAGVRDLSLGTGLGTWAAPTSTRAVTQAKERIGGGTRAAWLGSNTVIRAAKWSVAHDDAQMTANARRIVELLRRRHPSIAISVV